MMEDDSSSFVVIGYTGNLEHADTDSSIFIPSSTAVDIGVLTTTKEDKVHIGQVYRHYQGKIFRVLALAKSEETGEDLVVYRDAFSKDETAVCAMSIDDFTGMVNQYGPDEEWTVPRFTLVFDPEDEQATIQILNRIVQTPTDRAH